MLTVKFLDCDDLLDVSYFSIVGWHLLIRIKKGTVALQQNSNNQTAIDDATNPICNPF